MIKVKIENNGKCAEFEVPHVDILSNDYAHKRQSLLLELYLILVEDIEAVQKVLNES